MCVYSDNIIPTYSYTHSTHVHARKRPALFILIHNAHTNDVGCHSHTATPSSRLCLAPSHTHTLPPNLPFHSRSPFTHTLSLSTPLHSYYTAPLCSTHSSTAGPDPWPLTLNYSYTSLPLLHFAPLIRTTGNTAHLCSTHSSTAVARQSLSGVYATTQVRSQTLAASPQAPHAPPLLCCVLCCAWM